MVGFSFIHAADLHLGRPLGLRGVPDFLEQSAQRVDERLLNRLVDCCCAKGVDFLLISGDVFDDAGPSLRLQRSFQRAMETLHQGGVRVYIVEGNHDAGVWDTFLFSLPSSVHCFGAALESVGQKVGGWEVEIWGVNFQPNHRRESQAELFPPSSPADWSAVLLHAEQGESGEYHPLLHGQLYDSPFSYHALGHEHSFQHWRHPDMVYPGVPQGRDRNETGEKGVCLVTVSQRGTHVELLPINEFQWLELSLDITAKDKESVWQDLVDQARTAANSSEAFLLCQVVLQGSTGFHSQFMDVGFQNELLESWQEECLQTQSIWIDGLTYRGEPAVCFQRVSEQDSFFGEVLRGITAADLPEEIRRLEKRLGVTLCQEHVKEDARRLSAIFLTDESNGVDFDVD